MKINLGCGNKKIDGFIGIDKFPCDAVNIIADIENRLPLEDNSVSEIYMDNVIEHIKDIPALMSEVHRVSKNNALLTIITPHYSSISSWRDPTHIHHLAYDSMNHFEKKSVAHYMGGGFTILRRKLSFGGGFLGLIGRGLFKMNPSKYEAKYSFIFRASTLRFEMRVNK